MAFLDLENVRIAGFSAGVPKKIVKTKSRNPKYSDEEYIKNVGVEEKHIDDKFTTSDLCYYAAEQLISDLKWDKAEIDAIIFVSQFRDYILPATAPILQDRLGLSKECYASDISLGCSGWVYGLSSLASLMTTGSIKKGLLLVGDAKRVQDSSSNDPLFGYAGCVTALEYDKGNDGLKFHFGSDGSGYDAIIIPDGGARNGFTADSLIVSEDEDGIKRSRLNSVMKGMDVFSFAISTAPKSIKKLAQKHDIELEKVNYLLLHQANLKINQLIQKKLKFEDERVLNSLSHFGNTSSASIPMSIIANTSDNIFKSEKTFMACGFGVGLSWGSVYFKLKDCVISKIVEVE